MSTITKEEWNDWKLNKVTRAFFQATELRKVDAKEILANTAGIDPVNDNFYRGFITAYQEIPEFRIEDLDDEV